MEQNVETFLVIHFIGLVTNTWISYYIFKATILSILFEVFSSLLLFEDVFKHFLFHKKCFYKRLCRYVCMYVCLVHYGIFFKNRFSLRFRTFPSENKKFPTKKKFCL